MTDPTPTRDEAVPERPRIEPLLKDGDVVERLKQFRLRWQESGDLTYLGKALVDAVGEIEGHRRASAPAPASGGVDAVRQRVWSGVNPDGSALHPMVRQEMRDLLASLSPAATPVSEAGGEATGKPSLQVGDIPRAENTGRYLAETNDGRLLYLNHANEWQEMPNILAKPASSPAGGDTDFLRQRRGELVIERDAARAAVESLIAAIGNDGKVTSLHEWNERMQRAVVDAKIAIARDVRKERAALSQPTSAGRVGE